MDGLRGELEGTLARTAQKKQTALNRYERFKRDQEKIKKYGFATRPSATSEVTDLKAAEHFYREVRAEFSNKLARMNAHVTIEGNGTAEVRVINDELNALVREMQRWSNRIGALGGNAPQATDGDRPQYRYYGPAKQLPEATTSSSSVGGKRDREESDNEGSEMMGDEEYPSPRSSRQEARPPAHECLRPTPQFILQDADAEKTMRREEAQLLTKVAADLAPQRFTIKGYHSGAEGVPSEEEVWKGVLARRRAALMAKIKK